MAKAASKRLKAFMVSPNLLKTSSCQKQAIVAKRPLRRSLGTKEEVVEESLEIEAEVEDTITEPYGKKVKPNCEVSGSEVSNSALVDKVCAKVSEKEKNVNLSPLEFTKKKLDSIFMKNQNNKRRPIRPLLFHASEHYADIDRLLSQYSGKVAMIA